MCTGQCTPLLYETTKYRSITQNCCQQLQHLKTVIKLKFFSRFSNFYVPLYEWCNWAQKTLKVTSQLLWILQDFSKVKAFLNLSFDIIHCNKSFKVRVRAGLGSGSMTFLLCFIISLRNIEISWGKFLVKLPSFYFIDYSMKDKRSNTQVSISYGSSIKLA